MLRHSPHACMVVTSTVVTGYWVGQGSGTAQHFSYDQAVHGGYWLLGRAGGGTAGSDHWARRVHALLLSRQTLYGL